MLEKKRARKIVGDRVFGKGHAVMSKTTAKLLHAPGKLPV
jgi:hypothetical protein